MANSTIGGVAGFGILPTDGWWNYPRIDNYGGVDPQGNFKKPDSNILVPHGYPVASIEPGTVSGINTPNSNAIPSFGAVVTIKLDNPVNSLATHLAFLHLADVTVREGQRVMVGDVIGHAGDAGSAAGSAPASLGVALTPSDYYGFGSGWSYNAKADPQLNPVPLIESVANGTPINTNSTNVNNTALNIPVVQRVQQSFSLTPTEDVIAVFTFIDQVTTLGNPFTVLENEPNPLNWLPELLVEFGIDFAVIFIQGAFLLLGLYMCFKAVNGMINFTGKVQQAANVGLTAAKIATVAAV